MRRRGLVPQGRPPPLLPKATAERRRRKTPKKRKTRRTQRIPRKTTSPRLTLRKKSTRRTNSSRPHFNCSARPSDRQSVLACLQKRFVGGAVHRQIFPPGNAG